MKIIFKKYTNLFFILLCFLLVIQFESCQKDIGFNPLPYESELTVECILVPGQIPKLYLSKSVPFFDANVSPTQLFAKGATVTITGSATDVLVADSSFDKFRCRWVPFYIGSIPSVQGQSYSLSITYNSKTYTATTSITQAKVNISSTSYVSAFHDIYGEHEGVVVNYSDASGSENFYRYMMGRMIDSTIYGASNLGLIHSTCTNGEFFYVQEFGRSIYFDKGVDGQQLQFVIEPAFLHEQDDTGYVFIQSLDKAAALFYQSIDKQKLAISNPFVEPVFLQSNIEGCIGIFGSAVLSDSVLFVYPE